MPAVESAVSTFSQSESGSSFDEDDSGLPPGVGPWKLAWRRLRRNKTALFFGFIFILLVVLCLLAPVYSHDIAHTGPDTEAGLTGTVKVGGKVKDVVSATGIPIGPTWHAKYFFGADENGRDTAVRLLYGGRNSLEIGIVATMITMVLAVFLGVLAGFYRGWWDAVITRAADVIWAYPAVLLGDHARDRVRDRRDRSDQGHVPARARDRDRDRLHPVRAQADPRAGAADA